MYKGIQKINREKLQVASGGFNFPLNIPAIQKPSKLEVDSLLVVKNSDFYHYISVCASGSSKASGKPPRAGPSCPDKPYRNEVPVDINIREVPTVDYMLSQVVCPKS